MHRKVMFFIGLLFLVSMMMNSCGTTKSRQVPAPVSQPDGAAPLRVMSFNIRYDNPDDGTDAWSQRKSKVASMLRFHRVDVAGLQEAEENQIKDLQAALPDFAWFGAGRTDGTRKGEHCPVFYRRDKFKVLNNGTFWMSETPEVPGSKGWDARYPRITTWGEFQYLSGGRKFYLFNTHLDNAGEKAREESAKLLLKKIGEIAGNNPVILTGDFNAVKGSVPYDILTGPATPPGIIEPLHDAAYVSRYPHHGPGWTFHGFGTVKDRPRIDYIFVNDSVQVIQHANLPDHWNNGRYPSDHLPVVADVAFK